jgi:hypothetical protein
MRIKHEIRTAHVMPRTRNTRRFDTQADEVCHICGKIEHVAHSREAASRAQTVTRWFALQVHAT